MRKTLSDIIKETFLILNEKWNVYMCSGTLQLLISLVFVLFLPPFGYAVAFIFYTVTMVNLAGHNLRRYENKSAKFEQIFDFKNFFAILTTKIIKLVQICFWSIFLIVPGILVAIDYSMTDFILAENPKLDSFEALAQSTQLTRKHRAKILVLFCLYCLLSAIIVLFACSVILIAKFFTAVPNSVVITSLLIITGLLYLFVILPFIKVSLVILYKDLKLDCEKTKTKEQPAKKPPSKRITKTA